MGKIGLFIFGVVLLLGVISFVSAEIKCTDSDGGKDYYVSGIIEGMREIYPYDNETVKLEYTYERDFCVKDNWDVSNRPDVKEGIFEYYCEDNIVKITGASDFICPNGCFDGACIKDKEMEEEEGIFIFEDIGKWKIDLEPTTTQRFPDCVDGLACSVSLKFYRHLDVDNLIIFVEISNYSSDITITSFTKTLTKYKEQFEEVQSTLGENNYLHFKSKVADIPDFYTWYTNDKIIHITGHPDLSNFLEDFEELMKVYFVKYPSELVSEESGELSEDCDLVSDEELIRVVREKQLLSFETGNRVALQEQMPIYLNDYVVLEGEIAFLQELYKGATGYEEHRVVFSLPMYGGETYNVIFTSEQGGTINIRGKEYGVIFVSSGDVVILDYLSGEKINFNGCGLGEDTIGEQYSESICDEKENQCLLIKGDSIEAEGNIFEVISMNFEMFSVSLKVNGEIKELTKGDILAIGGVYLGLDELSAPTNINPGGYVVIEYLEGAIELEGEEDCPNGCELDNKCYPLGYRKSGEFCSDSLEFVGQLDGDAICENNFECGSNVCISGQCVETDLIRKIINWFKNFFS